MRCPDCNKFVSLEFAEPEPEEMDIDYDYDKRGPDQEHVSFTVTVDVRLVRNCAYCGQELKEGTLTLEGSDVLGHEMKDGCETASRDGRGEPDRGRRREVQEVVLRGRGRVRHPVLVPKEGGGCAFHRIGLGQDGSVRDGRTGLREEQR